MARRRVTLDVRPQKTLDGGVSPAMFADDLKARGWAEGHRTIGYTKGGWGILFDTSSWMIVSTEDNPRVFDVHVPGEYESRWTVNLIEHLCRMEDERARLRKFLEAIRDMPGAGNAVRSAAAEALGRCSHSWLVSLDVAEGRMGRTYCSICGQVAADCRPAEPSAPADPARDIGSPTPNSPHGGRAPELDR